MSTPALKTEDSDAAAPKTFTKKDHEVAFNKGKGAGLTMGLAMISEALASHDTSISVYMQERREQGDKVLQLVRDYELHSSNLDGSVLEILQEAQQMLNRDTSFLAEQRRHCADRFGEVRDKADEMIKVLKKQTEEGY